MTRILEIVGTDINLEIGSCRDCLLLYDSLAFCRAMNYSGTVHMVDVDTVDPACPLPDKSPE